jgi:hypothetical protein
MDVGFSIRDRVDLRDVADRMLDRAIGRRARIDTVNKLSRNVQGIYLNMGQDFDDEFLPLLAEMSDEIEWELAEAIPLIRKSVASTATASPFRSATYVKRHARMELSPSGRRWIEYAPVISRLLTAFDHLKDHPRAAAHHVPTSSN